MVVNYLVLLTVYTKRIYTDAELPISFRPLSFSYFYNSQRELHCRKEGLRLDLRVLQTA